MPSHASFSTVRFIRIDDFNASAKHLELYSRIFPRLLSFFPLYLMPRLSGWGLYPELDDIDWMRLYEYVVKYHLCVNIAVTAAYAGLSKIPLSKRYSQSAIRIISSLSSMSLVEVCSHGLTHCDDRGFRRFPKLFGSNRSQHREFGHGFSYSHQFCNLKVSKNILEDTFQVPVRTFVPPGSQYDQNTVEAAISAGFCNFSSRLYPGISYDGINFISDDYTLALHDRELFFEGVGYLDRFRPTSSYSLFSSSL